MKKAKLLGVCSMILCFVFVFNVVQAQDIDKAVIVSGLNSIQINTNLDNLTDIPDVTSASGLFFSKTGMGKIVFNSALNLNSDENSSVLNNVTTTLTFSERAIAFNPGSPSDFSSTSVTVFVYGLRGNSYSEADLTFDGATPTITGWNFANHTLTFTVDKFVSFTVADKPDTEAPIISFVSPTPAHNAFSNVDPAVIKISSNENLSKAVIQVGYYDNGDLELGTTNGFTTGTSSPWQINKSTVHSGLNSLKSALGTLSNDSWLKKNVNFNVSSSIYFFWKVDSDGDSNNLSLYVDNNLIETITGNQDWQLKKVQLSPGPHELKWSFTKGFVASGAGWLDDVMTFVDASSTAMSITNTNELTTAQASIGGLNQGKNYYKISVADLAGNESISFPFKVINFDNIAPVAVLSSLPAAETYGTNLSITVAGTDVSQYKYKLDNEEYTDAILVSNKLIKSPISAGEHTISVIGGDSVGNWQTEPTTYLWKVLVRESSGGGSFSPPAIQPISNSISKPITITPNPLSVKQSLSGVSSQTIGGVKVLGVKAFANGSLIRVSSTHRIYYLINGQKQYISSLKELKKYGGRKMYNISIEQASQYPDYRPNGTLLRTSDMKIFVINNGKRKHISSLAELKANYKGKQIINVPDGTINQYPSI